MSLLVIKRKYKFTQFSQILIRCSLPFIVKMNMTNFKNQELRMKMFYIFLDILTKMQIHIALSLRDKQVCYVPRIRAAPY